MPKVWNINDPDCPPDAVYCGRAVRSRGLPKSPYCNPFRVGSGKYTRDEACDRFEAKILPGLDVEPLRGKDLSCWCKPNRCHCDSILKKANAPLECSDVGDLIGWTDGM